MEKDPILVIEKPDFVVRLHKDVIEVDLKKGGKAKLEDAFEKDPLLRKTLGFVLQSTIPSDVELCDIKSCEVDDSLLQECSSSIKRAKHFQLLLSIKLHWTAIYDRVDASRMEPHLPSNGNRNHVGNSRYPHDFRNETIPKISKNDPLRQNHYLPNFHFLGVCLNYKAILQRLS